jgi:phosphate/sulfate permease
VASTIVIAWILTIPAAVLVSAIVFFIVRMLEPEA